MPLAIIEQLFSTTAPIQVDIAVGVFGILFAIISSDRYLYIEMASVRNIKQILKVKPFQLKIAQDCLYFGLGA